VGSRPEDRGRPLPSQRISGRTYKGIRNAAGTKRPKGRTLMTIIQSLLGEGGPEAVDLVIST